jgi:hypothetical protein
MVYPFARHAMLAGLRSELDLVLVHRRLQRIHMAAHQLFGLASIFPDMADRHVWVDA